MSASATQGGQKYQLSSKTGHLIVSQFMQKLTKRNTNFKKQLADKDWMMIRMVGG